MSVGLLAIPFRSAEGRLAIAVTAAVAGAVAKVWLERHLEAMDRLPRPQRAARRLGFAGGVAAAAGAVYWWYGLIPEDHRTNPWTIAALVLLGGMAYLLGYIVGAVLYVAWFMFLSDRP